MALDVKEYIRSLEINECNQCEEIKKLQSPDDQNINVAPLFWQGEGKQNIPLIIMGINPSVVGTTNEPKRGGDFEQYFNYYQNRHESEKESVIEAEARTGSLSRRLPRRYWTICHNLAKHLVGNGIERWKDYILMEAIHCFYNNAGDLTAEQSRSVAEKCFNRQTKNMLMTLKPRMIVLLGNAPYRLLANRYLDKPLDNYQHGFLCIDKSRTPVLRHSHPNPAGANPGPFYRPEVYKAFKLYCSNFVYDT